MKKILNFVVPIKRNMGRLELVIENEVVSIYSPVFDEEQKNEFHKFLMENSSWKNPQLKSFFDAIISAIRKMEECGARENLFRNEGSKVKAVPLYICDQKINRKIGKMRLYCLRLSERLLILGNGGVTTSNKYEDDPKMKKAVDDLRNIDNHIRKIAKRAKTDYEDFESIKKIVETITL